MPKTGNKPKVHQQVNKQTVVYFKTHIVRYQLYKINKMHTNIQGKQVRHSWEKEMWGSGQERMHGGKRKLLVAMDTFTIFSVVMVY